MGLDAYLKHASAKGADDAEVITHWRKYAALNEYMFSLYARENKLPGTREEYEKFNCVNFYLSRDLLLEIKGAMEQSLVKNSEFREENEIRWGSDWINDVHESMQTDTSSIDEALELVESGRCVYYYCWW